MQWQNKNKLQESHRHSLHKKTELKSTVNIKVSCLQEKEKNECNGIEGLSVKMKVGQI